MKVRVVPRKVLAGKDKGKTKYYGQVRAEQKISFDQVCRNISQLSSATKGDVQLVLHGFLMVMQTNLEVGNIVQLGDLGNFRLTAGSKGVEEKDKFHHTMMKKPRIIFTPGKNLEKVLDEVRFEKIEVRIIEVEEDCQQPHP